MSSLHHRIACTHFGCVQSSTVQKPYITYLAVPAVVRVLRTIARETSAAFFTQQYLLKYVQAGLKLKMKLMMKIVSKLEVTR